MFARRSRILETEIEQNFQVERMREALMKKVKRAHRIQIIEVKLTSQEAPGILSLPDLS